MSLGVSAAFWAANVSLSFRAGNQDGQSIENGLDDKDRNGTVALLQKEVNGIVVCTHVHNVPCLVLAQHLAEHFLSLHELGHFQVRVQSKRPALVQLVPVPLLGQLPYLISYLGRRRHKLVTRARPFACSKTRNALLAIRKQSRSVRAVLHIALGQPLVERRQTVFFTPAADAQQQKKHEGQEPHHKLGAECLTRSKLQRLHAR